MDIPFSGFLAFKLLHKKGVKMPEITPIYPLFPAHWHISGMVRVLPYIW